MYTTTKITSMIYPETLRMTKPAKYIIHLSNIAQPEPELCTICFDELQSKPSGSTICKHRFHIACIKTWGRQSSRPVCPLCRSSLFSLLQLLILDEKDSRREIIAEQGSAFPVFRPLVIDSDEEYGIWYHRFLIYHTSSEVPVINPDRSISGIAPLPVPNRNLLAELDSIIAHIPPESDPSDISFDISPYIEFICWLDDDVLEDMVMSLGGAEPILAAIVLKWGIDIDLFHQHESIEQVPPSLLLEYWVSLILCSE